MAPRMMAPGAEIADYLADTDRRGRARRQLETFQFEHLGCRLAARAGVMNAVIDDQPLIIGRIRHNVRADRSEEHTSELQSLMRISYAVFCLKKKTTLDRKHKEINTSRSTTSNDRNRRNTSKAQQTQR